MNECQPQDKFWVCVIKLTLWDSKWESYNSVRGGKKKGRWAGRPFPSLARGCSVPRAMGPQKEEQTFGNNTKTTHHLHFSPPPLFFLWLGSCSECSLTFPKQGSILHYPTELKITAQTHHHCCFCLAVVLLHWSQQSPISVKLQQRRGRSGLISVSADG